jgi:hypothetical protein
MPFAGVPIFDFRISSGHLVPDAVTLKICTRQLAYVSFSNKGFALIPIADHRKHLSSCLCRRESFPTQTLSDSTSTEAL